MTMLLVRVPECQQAVDLVTEYVAADDEWEVTSPKVDVVGRGKSFELAVRDFARKFSGIFGEGT